MLRQTKIASFLFCIESREMVNRRGIAVCLIGTALAIAPLLLASLASMALHTYVLSSIIQDQLTLVATTNSIPALILAHLCREYFSKFDQKFPSRIFNQSNLELFVWKGATVLLVSLLGGLIFTAIKYTPKIYMTSIGLFCLIAPAILLVLELVDVLFRFVRNSYIPISGRSRNNKVLLWAKYFFSFRWKDANGQAGLLISFILFLAAMYFIEESLLLSLSLFSLSVAFVFFDLITEQVIRHKIFIYSDISSLSFFSNSYKLLIIVFSGVTLLSFLSSFFAYGSTFVYVVIPIGFLLFTLYDSLASLSVAGNEFKKFTRRFLLPIGIGTLIFFNPIIGLLLFAGTTFWLFLSFSDRWRTVPHDHQIE